MSIPKPKYFPNNPILERHAIKQEVLNLAKQYIYLDENIDSMIENLEYKKLSFSLVRIRNIIKELLKLTDSPNLNKLYKLIHNLK